MSKLDMMQQLDDQELEQVGGGFGFGKKGSQALNATQMGVLCPDCASTNTVGQVSGTHAKCSCLDCGRVFDAFQNNGQWLNSLQAMKIL